MFQSLLICFREGLEAFLVIAVASLYLRRTGQLNLIGAVRWGMAAALAACAVLGAVLAQVGSWSSSWAGVMALVAAAAVMWCVVHMHRAGKTMGREITARLDQASVRTGAGAWWAVFGFTVFMVSREGIEAATMIASLAASAEARPLAIGGIAGVVLAGLIGLAWVRYGQKVNLSRFFRVTAWFMGVFAIQLVVYALHEFTESGAVPGIDNAYWHVATEDLAEGWIAQVIAIALVVLPTAWLVGAHVLDRRAAVRLSTSAA